MAADAGDNRGGFKQKRLTRFEPSARQDQSSTRSKERAGWNERCKTESSKSSKASFEEEVINAVGGMKMATVKQTLHGKSLETGTTSEAMSAATKSVETKGTERKGLT